ncbi:MAG: glutamine cyclotransferase [Polyangiaceae bacterium]
METMSMSQTAKKSAKKSSARILAEHGVPGVKSVHGVTYDGQNVVFVHGDGGELVKLGADGSERGRLSISGADAGVAFDGTHLWVVAGQRIQRVDPESGEVLGSIPAPDEHTTGLAWQSGALWAGSFRGQKLYKLDAESGKVLRTLESDRFVTGVSFSEGELWHGTYEGEGEEVRTELRRIDDATGEVLEVVEMPRGVVVSGLELFENRAFCGDHRTGTVRVVERPRR